MYNWRWELRPKGRRSRMTRTCALWRPEKGRPQEEIWIIPFDEKDPKKVFKISTTLGVEHKAMLIWVLREYRDIFKWEPEDMPWVDL
ncbi:hypothetical protein LIER_35465 [Lithospermum erythrorhizon]|uniref:Uncharacterized protein n=1 Tax=Lithospermum erythrorhizon TaxID=34254 RepID=A0AAV3NR60_LITER